MANQNHRRLEDVNARRYGLDMNMMGKEILRGIAKKVVQCIGMVLDIMLHLE